MNQRALDFSQFDAELLLAKRLKDHGQRVTDGITDAAVRRQRFRDVISAAGLDCVVIGAQSGKAETYAQYFERIYGESFKPKKRKGSDGHDS